MSNIVKLNYVSQEISFMWSYIENIIAEFKDCLKYEVGYLKVVN